MTNASPPKRAFFFLGQRGKDIRSYPHLAVVLAEGLSTLGWQISSNLSYWQPQPGSAPLFPGDQALESADLIVFEEDYFLLQGTSSIPPVANTGVPKIYLDRSDLLDEKQGHSAHPGLTYSKEFRKFDLILRCHSNVRFAYPANVYPTVYGISERIAQACRQSTNKEDRVIWNFRHTNVPHSVLRWAEDNVLPILAANFSVSGSKNSVEEASAD